MSDLDFSENVYKYLESTEVNDMTQSAQGTGLKYITHARSLEELRQEYLSDIKRRLDNLDAQKRFVGGSVAKQAQIAYAVRELEDLARFWQSVELRAAKRAKRGMSQDEAMGRQP